MPRRPDLRPLPQHQAKTVFLRCPTEVWGLVSTGKVEEFRAASGNASQLWNVPLPTLAVIYRPRRGSGEWDYRAMLLADVRREALGAISAEGLARAGYEGVDAMARFRRDWVIREKRPFTPLRTVFVYRVRPVTSEDLVSVGLSLVERLYGGYVDQTQHRASTVRTRRREDQVAREHRAAAFAARA